MEGVAGSPATVIVQSYRQLYRHLLRAVRYSTPARYVARDRLRDAFRKRSATEYNHASVLKTLEFLRGAAEQTGWEHHILRNLLHVAFWERDFRIRRAYTSVNRRVVVAHEDAMERYHKTLEMFNSSLGLCLY